MLKSRTMLFYLFYVTFVLYLCFCKLLGFLYPCFIAKFLLLNVMHFL